MNWKTLKFLYLGYIYLSKGQRFKLMNKSSQEIKACGFSARAYNWTPVGPQQMDMEGKKWPRGNFVLWLLKQKRVLEEH